MLLATIHRKNCGLVFVVVHDEEKRELRVDLKARLERTGSCCFVTQKRREQCAEKNLDGRRFRGCGSPAPHPQQSQPKQAALGWLYYITMPAVTSTSQAVAIGAVAGLAVVAAAKILSGSTKSPQRSGPPGAPAAADAGGPTRDFIGMPASTSRTPRLTSQLPGYGANPPDPKWPKGARIAINFVGSA